MKTLFENVALYSQLPTSVKLTWLLSTLALLFVGCTPKTKPSESAPATSAASNVPLRIWFVAAAEDQAVIERQWLANDERPIEVTVTTAEDLLSQAKPSCDVLVYPAWMLGELIARNWLNELPAKLLESGTGGPEETGPAMPAGWLEQARFNRKSWAVSLAVQTPVVLANFDIPKPTEVAAAEAATSESAISYWHSLAAALKSQTTDTKKDAQPTIDVDALAVADRFLTILFSISDPENKVGTLFQPDHLKPRVKDANFALSAQIMRELHTSGASLTALLGSHNQAWQALTEKTPNLTIGLPPAPGPDTDKINAINVSSPPSNPSKAGTRITTGWNSGRGLMASLSKQCRQTSASIDFVGWLSSPATRQGFAKRIVGMNAESAYAPGSSAWQAQHVAEQLGAQGRLPNEPRLPRALEYRRTLGEQIAQAVRGDKSIEAALADLEKAWQEITTQADTKAQAAAYLHSLGL